MFFNVLLLYYNARRVYFRLNDIIVLSHKKNVSIDTIHQDKNREIYKFVRASVPCVSRSHGMFTNVTNKIVNNIECSSSYTLGTK